MRRELTGRRARIDGSVHHGVARPCVGFGPARWYTVRQRCESREGQQEESEDLGEPYLSIYLSFYLA